VTIFKTCDEKIQNKNRTLFSNLNSLFDQEIPSR